MRFQRRRFRALLCLTVALSVAQGQERSRKKAEFEVAAVKLVSPADMQRLVADMRAGRSPKVGPQIEGSRATYAFMSLDSLIAIAYSARLYQISGPKWMSNERFHIEATIPKEATRNDVPGMLRSLLEERFKLKARQAKEEHKVLGLVVSKDGVKMKKVAVEPKAIDVNSPLKPGEQQSEEPDGPVRTKVDPDGTVTRDMGSKGTIVWKPDTQNKLLILKSNGLSLEGYAEVLSYLLMQMNGPSARQVVDMTGLKGHYEVDVEISLADLRAMGRTMGTAAPTGQPGSAPGPNAVPEPAEPAGMSVLDSVKLAGLKLESRNAMVNRLVVDHVEKTPTEN